MRPALRSLACVLSIASSAPAAAGGRILDFDVSTDGCGGWAATVRAQGTGQRLMLRTNRDVTAEWEVEGEQVFSVRSAAAPGDELELEVAFARGRRSTRSFVIPPFLAEIGVSPRELLVAETREPRFDLKLDTACDVSAIEWLATVRQTGVTRSGRFLPTGTAWFVFPGEQRGIYDVDVEVRAGNVELLRTTFDYEVGDVDVDRDGRKSRRAGGDDCDDENAAVHVNAADPPGDGLDLDCDGVP